MKTLKERLEDVEKELNLKIDELNDERKRASSTKLDLQGKLSEAEKVCKYSPM